MPKKVRASWELLANRTVDRAKRQRDGEDSRGGQERKARGVPLHNSQVAADHEHGEKRGGIGAANARQNR